MRKFPLEHKKLAFMFMIMLIILMLLVETKLKELLRMNKVKLLRKEYGTPSPPILILNFKFL